MFHLNTELEGNDYLLHQHVLLFFSSVSTWQLILC